MKSKVLEIILSLIVIAGCIYIVIKYMQGVVMSDILLKELNWKVTSTDVGGSYDKKWFGKIKSTIENLIWLQDKGWRDTKINIQTDLCDKLDVPDWFIRFTVGYITDDFPSVKKRFDMRS